MSKDLWEVIVGNVGIVYSGKNGFTARHRYSTYVGQSNSGVGRASGESVTLMLNGEIVKEHTGADALDMERLPDEG